MRYRNLLVRLVSVLVLLAGAALTGGVSADSGAASATTTTVVIDVRTSDEFASGHLAGAQNLDYRGGEFTRAVANLDRDSDYVLYCRSGNRAGKAKALMEELGFKHVRNLGGLEQAGKAMNMEVVR